MPQAMPQQTRPNILILMVDQLNGTFFPDGPADFLHAPNLRKLAARSARGNETSYTFSLDGVTAASRLLERCG